MKIINAEEALKISSEQPPDVMSEEAYLEHLGYIIYSMASRKRREVVSVLPPRMNPEPVREQLEKEGFQVTTSLASQGIVNLHISW